MRAECAGVRDMFAPSPDLLSYLHQVDPTAFVFFASLRGLGIGR